MGSPLDMPLLFPWLPTRLTQLPTTLSTMPPLCLPTPSPMPSTPPPLSMLPTLPTPPLSLSTLLAIWLRFPLTPTTMALPTTTPRLPSARLRATMAPVLLRDPTLSTFPTAVSRLSPTTPMTLMAMSPRCLMLVRPSTLMLSLLPTLCTLPPSLPTLSMPPLWLTMLSTLPLLLPTLLLWPTPPLWSPTPWDRLLWILFMEVIYFMINIAQFEQRKK